MSEGVKLILGGAAGLAVLGVIGSYAIGSNPEFAGASVLNMFLGMGAPGGELTVEVRQPATKGALPVAAAGDADEWRSYNRTVTSDRFSPLADINPQTAGRLRVLCSYDTGKLEGNETGLIMAGGALVGTTSEDIFSIDPNSCKQNWRVHKDAGLWTIPVNRGAVYADGKVIRGFNDLYVRAFDARTGQQLWETFIGQRSMPGMGMTSAPIAWNGQVIVGTAGGDMRNVRGRVLSLDVATGKVNWQISTVPTVQGDDFHGPQGKMPQDAMLKTWANQPDIPISGGGTWTSYTIDPSTGYLYIPVGNSAPDYIDDLRPGANMFANHVLVVDARTGDYVKSYQVMKQDWHDWDISNTPVIYTTRAGRKQFSMSPKDGHLYSYDRTTDRQLYRNPVTKMHNTEAKFAPGQSVYVCPGSVGGGEWNGTAYDAQYNLLFTPTVERCMSVKIESDSEAARAKDGTSWIGVATSNPLDIAGGFDGKDKWGGWLYATDADTGQWAWRARTNYPVLGGVTPTAGGVVMFGDIGGNFYVLDARDGAKLWAHHFDGALAGGIITYNAGAGQRVALTAGMAHPLWPVEPRMGRIVVLGM